MRLCQSPRGGTGTEGPCNVRMLGCIRAADGWNPADGERGRKGETWGSEPEGGAAPPWLQRRWDVDIAVGLNSTVPVSCPSRVLPRYSIPPRCGTRPSVPGLQQMQFSKHNVAWKTPITYFLVVIQRFRVNARAAVCCCSLSLFRAP